MRYRNAIIALGILVAVTLSPFIGVPRSWKEVVASLFGLLASALAYAGSRPRQKASVQKEEGESQPTPSNLQ